jgi:hypothetical protein
MRDSLNKWQCTNNKCGAVYAEYVNGCPKCATGKVGGSHKVKRVAKPPRGIRFCWHCSRKLRGNHFVKAKVNGHMRVMHKACHKKGGDYMEPNNDQLPTTND